MRYAVALPRVYVSWPRRNESLPKRPILPNLASPDSCCPRGVTIATFYRAFVPVSLVQIVLLKIVSLELRFCPAYPVESLIVPFFPLFFSSLLPLPLLYLSSTAIRHPSFHPIPVHRVRLFRNGATRHCGIQ